MSKSTVRTLDDLIRVIEAQSDRIDHALERDGTWVDLFEVLEEAALTALDDIREAAHQLKNATKEPS